MEKITLGLMIKAQRKKCGYTTEELASKVGINRSYITRFENEDIYPSSHIFEKIVNALTTGESLKKLRYKFKKLYYTKKYPDIIAFVNDGIYIKTHSIKYTKS
ncbi:MAG: helix-turn-helix transcriptional regulator [Candidatus Omnitrophica bacterium]|nr:helix-turn-helix transcriptional regulator [Candidatus Omnitrophota bacterium]